MQNIYGVYGLYQKVRNASWHILIDNNISFLPVDIVKIITDKGIIILKDSDVHELQEGELGITVYDGGVWYIIYDDSNDDLGRKRFTIAHELAHILLGHPLTIGYHARNARKKDPRIEKEADSLAMRLLAPACVLWGLDIHTAAEISATCGICSEYSKKRAERMTELYKRGKFLTSKLEEKLYEQFKDYIEKNRPQTIR